MTATSAKEFQEAKFKNKFKKTPSNRSLFYIFELIAQFLIFTAFISCEQEKIILKISNINFPFINKVPQSGFVSNPISFCGIGEDVFVKSDAQVSKKSDSSVYETSFSLEEFNKLYDTVYSDSLNMNFHSNPILSHLNLPKPKMIVASNSELGFGDTGAAYRFFDNSIIVNENFLKEDIYLSYPKREEDCDFSIISISSELEKDLDFFKSDNISFETVKLNKKEKELYLKSCLAHELRHFFQQHLIASGEESSQDYISKNVRMANIFNQLISTMGESDGDALLVDTSYAQNYSPRMFLPQSLQFKYSCSDSDSRYMTLDDLYKSWEFCKGKYIPDSDICDLDEYLCNLSETYGDSFNEDLYLSVLSEFDAYNHELEYIYLHQKDYAQGARKFVLDLLIKNRQNTIVSSYSCANSNGQIPDSLKL